MSASQAGFPVATMARVLGVSTAGQLARVAKAMAPTGDYPLDIW